MSNLPGLSLGSRFWDKGSAVTLIQTPRSRWHFGQVIGTQDWIAGLGFFFFWKTCSLRQQSPLWMSSCNIYIHRDGVTTLHRWGSRGERSSKIFEEFLWLSLGFPRQVVAEPRNQPSSKSCLRLLSWGIGFFFGDSGEVAPRQTNTIRETKLDHVFGYSELKNQPTCWSFLRFENVTVTYAACHVLQVISRGLWECFPCEELCLLSLWSFIECVSEFWWIPGGFYSFSYL